jgi:MFS family permease
MVRVGPLLALGVVGGVVADRVDRRRLLIGTQLGLGLLALGLGLWTYAGLAHAWPLYFVSLLSGTLQVFDTPARQSLLPNLVPEEQLGSAIALDALAQKVAKVLGPVLMGVVIAGRGPGFLYLLNAASYLAVLAALVMMRTRSAPLTHKRRSGLHEAREALHHVRRSRVLAPLLAMDFLVSFLGESDTMLPIFATEVLHLGAKGYGLLAAAAPAGAVLGSFGSAIAGGAANPWRRSIQSTVVYGLGMMALGLSRSLPLAFLSLGIASAADTVGSVLRNTVRHATTPDALRGRVAALNSVLSKTGPRLGEMEAGIVTALIGVRASIALGGALCLVAVTAIAGIARRLRDLKAAETDRSLAG